MNKKLNRKGFTLIELLAVIVILAILVMLAIPAVTRYLTAARQGAFSDNAKKAIDAVRTDVITNGFSADQNNAEGVTCTIQDTTNKCVYSLDAINNLLEKKLITSPFGPEYKTETGTGNDKKPVSQVVVTQIYSEPKTPGGEGKTEYIYQMCLIDKGNNGFEFTLEGDISSKAVRLGGVTECGGEKTSNDSSTTPSDNTTQAG